MGIDPGSSRHLTEKNMDVISFLCPALRDAWYVEDPRSGSPSMVASPGNPPDFPQSSLAETPKNIHLDLTALKFYWWHLKPFDPIYIDSCIPHLFTINLKWCNFCLILPVRLIPCNAVNLQFPWLSPRSAQLSAAQRRSWLPALVRLDERPRPGKALGGCRDGRCSWANRGQKMQKKCGEACHELIKVQLAIGSVCMYGIYGSTLTINIPQFC